MNNQFPYRLNTVSIIIETLINHNETPLYHDNYDKYLRGVVRRHLTHLYHHFDLGIYDHPNYQEKFLQPITNDKPYPRSV